MNDVCKVVLCSLKCNFLVLFKHYKHRYCNSTEARASNSKHQLACLHFRKCTPTKDRDALNLKLKTK